MTNELGDVAGEMRAEWRAEQEAAGADAAEQWRHGRRLTDWFADRMHAGDRIAVTVAGVRFAGLVEETGPDLIALRAVFGRVDVHIVSGVSLLIEIVDKAPSGGGRAKANRSFHDALLERDANPNMTLGTLHDPEGLDGTPYVGQDFVVVVARQGAETVVPLHNVTWVSTRRG